MESSANFTNNTEICELEVDLILSEKIKDTDR